MNEKEVFSNHFISFCVFAYCTKYDQYDQNDQNDQYDQNEYRKCFGDGEKMSFCIH